MKKEEEASLSLSLSHAHIKAHTQTHTNAFYTGTKIFFTALVIDFFNANSVVKMLALSTCSTFSLWGTINGFSVIELVLFCCLHLTTPPLTSIVLIHCWYKWDGMLYKCFASNPCRASKRNRNFLTKKKKWPQENKCRSFWLSESNWHFALCVTTLSVPNWFF